MKSWAKSLIKEGASALLTSFASSLGNHLADRFKPDDPDDKDEDDKPKDVKNDPAR